MKSLVRAMQPVDYLALYPAKVHSQDADGTLQVFPDSSRIPKMANVRLRTPFPQCKVQVGQGTRVLLGFEAGDPSLPYCSLWDSTAGTVVLVTLGDEDAAQSVALSNLVKNELDAIKSEFDSFADYINQHTHPAPGGATSAPSVSTTVGYSAGEVAATKLKAE